MRTEKIEEEIIKEITTPPPHGCKLLGKEDSPTQRRKTDPRPGCHRKTLKWKLGFSDVQGLWKLASKALLLRKLLKGLFHQEKGVNQERRRFQEMESAQD